MSVLVCLILITFIVLTCIKVFKRDIKPLRDKSKIKDVSSYCRLDNSTHTLYLYERNPKLYDVIVIRDYKIYIDKYKPKTLVYTGATVGGFSAGGFHEEGGYKYNIGSINTDKCFMTLLDEGSFTKIQLTDELFLQAQNSNIKGFLDNEKKQIKMIGYIIPSVATMASARVGNLDVYEHSREEDAVKAMPTKSECLAIKSWICGY